MSQHVPPGPYVYQPGPAPPPPIDAAKCRIWSVGGPGMENYAGQRYTKAEAERIVESVKNQLAAKLLDWALSAAVDDIEDER